ncbi:MAG: HU family DNA-binding protein [Bacteroidaceae bacterium]|nr:HU family DNA-binding protein [Bacteroidaceae bacterium]
MSDKISIQVLIDALARQKGVSKKVAESLSKAFFETIEEGLKTDGMVKVPGLGMFKIVEVGSRESVNVNTGERFLIAGYKKVSLVPEDGLLSQMAIVDNANDEEESEDEASEAMDSVAGNTVESAANDAVEPVVNDTEVPEKAEEAPAVEEPERIVLETKEPQGVEAPADDFSMIDMLIATPESLEEVRQQVAEARVRAEQTLAEAQEAHDELRRLECLLERLEKGMIPEAIVSEPAEATVACQPAELATVAMTAVPAVESIVTEPIPEPVEETEDSAEANEIEAEEPNTAENVETAEEAPADVPAETSESEAEPASEPVAETSAPEPDAEPASEPDAEPASEPVAETPASEPVAEASVSEPIAEVKEEKKIVELPKSMMVEDRVHRGGMSWWMWVLIPVVGIALGIGLIVGYRYIQNRQFEEQMHFQQRYDGSSDVEHVEALPVAPQTDQQMKDSLSAEKNPATGAAADAGQNTKSDAKDEVSARPKTYMIRKGDYLTRISLTYYGTKDSVQAIIRANKFADPNNIPIGSTIILP